MRILSRLIVLAALFVVGGLVAVLIHSSVHGPVVTETTTTTKHLTKTVVDTVTMPVHVAVEPALSPDGAVVVLSPRKGEEVQSGFTVSGEADVPQGQLLLHLYDAQGTELIRQPLTTTCTTSCRGLYETTVYYSVTTAQTGQLVVEDRAGKDVVKLAVKLGVVKPKP